MRVLKSWLTIAALFLFVKTTKAGEFEPLGNAVGKALKIKGGKVRHKKVNVGRTKNIDVFYTKTSKYAAVKRKLIYDPDCTHTWVIGVHKKTYKVNQIRVVEMSCPHAFPTKEKSFLSQYKGVGPKDLKRLDKKVRTIAKATGSSELTTDAVKQAIQAVKKLRGKI